jgi:hypothetical protein
MKAEIYRLHPELLFADNTDETLQQLINTAREAWHEIKDRILYNLLVTMHRRVKVV